MLVLCGMCVALGACGESGNRGAVAGRGGSHLDSGHGYGSAVPAEPARNVNIAATVHAVSPAITLGAVVVDRERDEELVAINAGRQFRSASIVKLLIAIDTLRREPDSRERVAEMLTYSDNRIASALWVDGGWGAIVSRTAARIGLRDTEPPQPIGQWGNTLLSAQDVVRIYRYILTELSATDRELIISALAGTSRVASDGWYQHFGIPDGIEAPWAIKQGWSNSAEDYVVHTTGLVGGDYRYIVVLLLEDDVPASWDTLRRAATAAAAETAPLFVRGAGH